MLRPARYALAATAGLALILAAAAPTAAAGKLQVKIDNLVFAPAKLTAHVGDTVEWTNADFVAHTATAKDGSFDVALPAGKTGSTVLKKAGHFDYYCKFHPNMKAEIDVVAK